jgi:predicted SAM-dependent methyltransferase
MLGNQFTAAFRRSLANAKREFHFMRLHRASARMAARLAPGDLKLNIACGPNVKPGWVNVDLLPAADLHLDLREPLPFPDNSVSIIYSEHFFEHLEFPDEAERFLAESLRVLARGGVFSVGVPDTEWPLRAYVTGDDSYFRLARDEMKWHPAWCDTRLHQINFHFRQGQEHKYAYDYETLESVLKKAGFVSVTRREFDPSLDSESRKIGTLYAEGRKP